jgi:tetratricopeptide (TPR) repeat protein
MCIRDRYYEHGISQRGCLGCRERVVDSFSELPLPKGAVHEVGALLYRFGTLNQEAENHVRAIESFKKCLKLSPTEEAGPICFRLGLSYTKTGHHDEALEFFNIAEPTYDDQDYFHFYTGLCYFEMGDYRMALERFSEAVRLNPRQEDLVRILIYMGTCHNSLGEYEKALVQLEKAKETAGPVKEIYNALGFSYFQLKDYDKAIENLNGAVEIDPDSAIDYASLGSNYREKGDINMAIAM